MRVWKRHFDARLFEHLAVDGLLGALSRFDEAGEHAEDARRKMR